MLNKNLKNTTLCKVRTITSFLTLSKDQSTWEKKIAQASLFGGNLANEFSKNNYEVQSIRIVTNAFGEYLNTSCLQSAREDMQTLSDILKSPNMPNFRIRFAIGEAKTAAEVEMLPELIKEFGDICNACVNVEVDDLGVPDDEMTQLCAKAVAKIGQITPRGEGNFNFTVNYNCKPLSPIFLHRITMAVMRIVSHWEWKHLTCWLKHLKHCKTNPTITTNGKNPMT